MNTLTSYHHVFDAMGTSWHITGVGKREAEVMPAMWAAEQTVHDYDRRFSRFQAGSELYELNERSGQWVAVSAEFWDVLIKCLDLARQTNGVFDPSVGSLLAARGYGPTHGFSPETISSATFREIELDEAGRRVRCKKGQILELAAEVKGLAIDAAGKHLAHLPGFLLNGGGDVLASGLRETGAPWHVGVQDPFENDAIVVMVSLKDMALATSGPYRTHWTSEQGPMNHLVDMKRRTPAGEVASVSVIAPTAQQADSLATVAALLGIVGGAEFLQAHGVPYYMVGADRRVIKNETFASFELAIAEHV